MAIDAYLQIEGIKGESTDKRHKGWIEVAEVFSEVHQPRAATVSTAGGHTSGKAESGDIMFQKIADRSSLLLVQHCAMAKMIPKATFEFLRADGEGKPIPYFKIELEDVLISNMTRDSGDGGTIKETVRLGYAKLKWTYTKQIISGPKGEHHE